MSEKPPSEPSPADCVKVFSKPDTEVSDNPQGGKEFWTKAVRWPVPKQQITLRLDADVLDFFRKQGRGYQTAINAVLRQYMKAHQR
ncbi:MAG TPA: BrnA antitoxin family protein [Spirochaetia bacterium]|nr:BrnA antitoxin family protein [Spirochaetia bacterium]